jgi:hypothetical protein
MFCASAHRQGRILCRRSDIGWIPTLSRLLQSESVHMKFGRVKGDRNWLVFADRRRIAKDLLNARRSDGLTHFFFIFTCSEFPFRWKCAVVLPVSKLSYPGGFSDFRPSSHLSCLSKVCEVLMAGQMNS